MPAPKGKKAARTAVRPARTRASKSIKTKKKAASPRRPSAPAPKARKASPAKASKSPKPKSGKSSRAPLLKKGAKPARPAARGLAPKSGAKSAPKSAPKASAKAVVKGKAAPAAPLRKGPAPAAAPAAKRTGSVAVTPAAKAAPKPLPARPAAAPRPAAKPSRRSRPRIEADSTPHAAWFPQPGGRQPASFIPAPPRAEAPSNVAAPPATADRIVRPSDMAVDSSVRHHPVRIDIEYSAGRTVMIMHPEELIMRPGEGIEWDFRYTGGADLMVEEILIEFPKPSPFGKPSIRAKKPSSQRHRQLSGPAADATVRLEYIIRAINAFKTEVAIARPRLVIEPLKI